MNGNVAALVVTGVVAVGTLIYYLFFDEKPQAHTRGPSNRPHNRPPLPPQQEYPSKQENTAIDKRSKVSETKKPPQPANTSSVTSSSQSTRRPPERYRNICSSIRSPSPDEGRSIRSTSPCSTIRSPSPCSTIRSPSPCSTIRSPSPCSSIRSPDRCLSPGFTSIRSPSPDNVDEVQFDPTSSDLFTLSTVKVCQVCKISVTVKFFPCNHSVFCEKHAKIYMEKAEYNSLSPFCPELHCNEIIQNIL